MIRAIAHPSLRRRSRWLRAPREGLEADRAGSGRGGCDGVQHGPKHAHKAHRKGPGAAAALGLLPRAAAPCTESVNPGRLESVDPGTLAYLPFTDAVEAGFQAEWGFLYTRPGTSPGAGVRGVRLRRRRPQAGPGACARRPGKVRQGGLSRA